GEGRLAGRAELDERERRRGCFTRSARLAKVRGRISKARGRKIQIIRKEIQSRGKRNPSFFLPRIGPFQGLAGESRLRDCEVTPEQGSVGCFRGQRPLRHREPP